MSRLRRARHSNCCVSTASNTSMLASSSARAGQMQAVYAKGQTQIYQLLPADHPPAELTTSLPVQAPVLPKQKSLLLDVAVGELPAVHEYAWNRLADSPVVAVLLWLLA